MPLLKPGPWTINRPDIEPQFAHLWTDLVLLMPLFANSVTNVINGDRNTASFANWSWTPTTLGVALTADGSQGRLEIGRAHV